MKRIISMVLILMLCLGLCACGAELNKEQMARICGTWYMMYGDEPNENPGYFELRADGMGTFNGKDAFEWTARPDREEPSHLIISMKFETKEKYTFDLYTGDGDVPEAILRKEKEGPATRYWKADGAVGQSWFADLQTRWDAVEEDTPIRTVTLNADGTVRLDDQIYFWTKAVNWEHDENRIRLNLYNDRGTYGYITAEIRGNGLYEFRVGEYHSGWSYSYYSHPLLHILGDGSWESFERYTMIDDYFILGTWYNSTTIVDTEYTIRFDTKTSQEELTVCFLEGDTVRYVANIFMDGEYPMATLTDQQSGQQTLYFNNYYGHDPQNPDAVYYKTVNMVYQFANGYGIYSWEEDRYLDEKEQLPYIYEKLTALGDYKQAQEFLDRFTIVPGKLTELTLCTTDRLNNVNSGWVNRYGYDENGVLIWARGADIPEMYGVYDISTPQYFTYDAKGKIAEVRLGHGDDVSAVGTPIFDTVGKLVGMSVQERSREYTSVYTYGAGGRVIRLEIPEADYGDSRIYEYTYDDGGKLVTKVLTLWEGRYVTTSNYIYDGDVLVEIRQTRCDWGDEYNWTYTYINDDQGRPLSAVITTDDPAVTYKAQEYQYIYEDLYFFDNTGLVFEN